MRLIMMIIILLIYNQYNAYSIRDITKLNNDENIKGDINNKNISASMEYNQTLKIKVNPFRVIHKVMKDIKDIKNKTIHILSMFITFVQELLVVQLIQKNYVIGFDEW